MTLGKVGRYSSKPLGASGRFLPWRALPSKDTVGGMDGEILGVI